MGLTNRARCTLFCLSSIFRSL